MKRDLLVLVLAAASLCAACASGQQEEPAAAPGRGFSGTAPVPSRGPADSGGGGAGGCPTGCETQPPGCFIKGNINLKTGERVYHVPGQRHYDNVTVEPGAGERWFCTESEAESSGWRRSKR
jgi:hypothetical protein